LLQLDGRARGVLDVDSYDIGAFDETDVQGMNQVLLALGLTRGTSPIVRL